MAVAKSYNVFGYFNTGLNASNIPYNSGVITSNFSAHSFPSCVLLQNKGLATLKLETTWEDVDGLDYVCVQNTTTGSNVWYFVTDIQMSNLNVAVVSLAMDAVTTIGLDNLEWTAGWVERKHVSNDDLFAYTLEEPFQPSNSLIIDGTEELKMPNDNKMTLFASSVCLEDATLYSSHTYDDESGNSVTIPSVPRTVTPGSSDNRFKVTTLTIQDFALNPSNPNVLPTTALYSVEDSSDSVFSKIVSRLREIGIEDVLSAGYTVPVGGTYTHPLLSSQTEVNTFAYVYSHTGSEDYKHMLQVITAPFIKVMNMPFEYDISIKNKKVFMGQYNTYVLASIVSGNSMEYLAQDIKYPDKDSPVFAMWIDPSPEGKPYARPFSYKNDRVNMFLNAVEGSGWQSSPLTFTTASGKYFDTQAAAYRARSYQREMQNMYADRSPIMPDALKGIIKGGLNMLEGTSLGLLFNAYSSLVGSRGGSTFSNPFAGRSDNPFGAWQEMAAQGSLAASKQARQQSAASDEYLQSVLDFNKNAYVLAPDIHFPRSSSLQSYIGNNFLVYRVRLSSADAKRFDRFLTMYGYRVDEPLSAADFRNREYFNFIKCSEIQLKVNQSRYIREAAENALKMGVRIWHTAPDPSKYNYNPIRPEVSN